MAQIAQIRSIEGTWTLVSRFPLNGSGKARGRVDCADGTVYMPPAVGQESGVDKVVPVETAEDDQSTTARTTTQIVTTVEANRVLDTTVTTDVSVTIEMVAAERQRRFDLGFDYDFGDSRGVHHFGTTEQDKKGWDEVSDMSNAAIALGSPSTTIGILTETGPATITAIEWQSILLAAAQARQPLWAASFALQAMDPIPADYDDDGYWT